ncbi:hypothetical protein GCG54_00013018 [Colletotrichum gloeosporioides]|uniref:Formylmethionine deformylase n=1 Tax=Colletotrichum gloeosporioides TaxID=474922 RepID=A0A8H4CQV4_COLGL|nr:uncharacterized protein GCG54_00013018 [Colletotrichum gloeosporioides]KAF3808380.1 hypothetical protein GCG54_00013018 [Colletotrichum gloeosporioides]
MEMSEIPRRPSDKTEPYHTRPSSPSTTNDVDITEIRDNFGSHERLVSPKQDSNPVFIQHVSHSTELPKANWWERLLLTRDLWSPTWNIYLFCIIGIGFAIGHHVFYASLEGKIVYGDDQLLMLRYGTALAFAAKASLVASVLTAFREQMWATARSRMISISTLDDMFAAPETPLSLLNLEFISKAKTVAVLALYEWLSPLIVILTTNTLLAKPALEVQQTSCPGVRTLNFSREATNEFRDGLKIDGYYRLSVNLWNTTSVNVTDPSFFDYWAGPSDQGKEVFQAATTLKRPFTNIDDTFAVCEKGWNCTAEVQFAGPAYKCQEMARGVGATVRSLEQESGVTKPPFPFKRLAPMGNYTWHVHATLGDYTNPQLNEPVVWVGYSEYLNTSLSSNDTSNIEAWDPVLIACEHYEAAYTAELRFIDGAQVHRIKSRKLLAPLINTTLVEGKDANDGTTDNTTATPETNYILPTDTEIYRKTAAYHTIGCFFRHQVNGSIYQPWTVVDTRAIYTSLIDNRYYTAVPNLRERLEEYYETLILSLFGDPRFIAVGWAANPSMMATSTTGTNYTYPCTRSRPAIAYYYRARILALVYGMAVFLAIMGVAAGTIALRKNGGVSRNTRFSSIMAATRAKSLNHIDWNGPQRDRGHISNDVMRQKLGYGKLRSYISDEVHRDGSHESKTAEAHYGFGFEGEVDQTPAVRSRRVFLTNTVDG